MYPDHNHFPVFPKLPHHPSDLPCLTKEEEEGGGGGGGEEEEKGLLLSSFTCLQPRALFPPSLI